MTEQGELQPTCSTKTPSEVGPSFLQYETISWANDSTYQRPERSSPPLKPFIEN